MIRGMFDHEWFGQVIIHLPFATLKAPKGPVLIIAPSMTLAQNWEMQWNLHVDGSHPRTGMGQQKGYGSEGHWAVGSVSLAVKPRTRCKTSACLSFPGSSAPKACPADPVLRAVFGIEVDKDFSDQDSLGPNAALTLDAVYRTSSMGFGFVLQGSYAVYSKLKGLPSVKLLFECSGGSNNGYILALGNCWIQTVLVSDNLAQMNEGMWKDGQMFFKVGEITERIPNKRFRWTA
ncbi:hypothetical protein DTO027B5_7336 [Paecilomyces variotii]|nr:hypothetical protein DTO027B3_4545 [Paecilomyces variotii]KAJ9330909.1 hypothetical protein DTO027B5_7336 [Paecilomyces variotii]